MNNTLVNNGAKFSGSLGTEIERSVFDLKWRDMTSCSVGALYPIMFEEVISGDKFKIDTAITSIMQPSIYPTCDDIVADIHYFYCPFRILWKNFRKFIGEEIPSDYDDQEALVMPYFETGGGALDNIVGIGDLMDRLGVQPGVKVDGANSLPYRMYRFTWNEWYRSSEIQDPVLVDRDADVDSEYIPYLLKVNRFKDYFSSCLPRPQAAAEPAIIPLTGLARVLSDNDVFGGSFPSLSSVPSGTDPVTIHHLSGTSLTTPVSGDMFNLGSVLATKQNIATVPSGADGNLVFSNLAVNFDNQINAVGSTVTALRQAVATQRFLEVSQRGGYRYRELIKAHYGTEIPDSTAQIPQFLGGARFNINMAANVQTSANSGDQAAGSLSGVSITREKDFGINEHVFTEPGLVMGFISFRVLNHTYQQGCPRFFFKKSKFDLYWPEFSRISEQPVYKGELYLNQSGFLGEGNDNFAPWGYNESYAEYRYHPSRLSGQVRRSFEQRSLSPWTYADYYTLQPTLSSSWLTEPRENVDDTLTYIGEETSERPSALPDVYYYDNGLVDQFVVDVAFKIRAERPMPLYGIPGLDVI